MFISSHFPLPTTLFVCLIDVYFVLTTVYILSLSLSLVTRLLRIVFSVSRPTPIPVSLTVKYGKIHHAIFCCLNCNVVPFIHEYIFNQCVSRFKNPCKDFTRSDNILSFFQYSFCKESQSKVYFFLALINNDTLIYLKFHVLLYVFQCFEIHYDEARFVYVYNMNLVIIKKNQGCVQCSERATCNATLEKVGEGWRE